MITKTPSGKMLTYPAEKFSDLFEEWSLDPKFDATPIHNEAASNMKIGNYCTTSNSDALYVKPKSELIEAIKANTIGIDYDTMYFKCIDQKNGTTLVVCSYGLIIGSRWLALIKTSSMPKEKT